jgi:ribosomal protein S27AE
MSSPYQPPSEFTPAPRRRIWPIVLLGCGGVGFVVVAACAGLIFFGVRQVTGKGEVAVEVDDLFQEIAQGRAAEFYRSRASDELKRATSERDFVALSQSINEHLGKFQSKTVTGFTVSTTYADVIYDCQFDHGKATVKTRFVHENGHWLLQAFHVDSPELVKEAVRKKCPNCGSLYEPGAKFCPNCGEKLEDDSAAEDRESKSGVGSETP